MAKNYKSDGFIFIIFFVCSTGFNRNNYEYRIFNYLAIHERERKMKFEYDLSENDENF